MDEALKISENISKIYRMLPQGVRLVAVSKFHPVSAIYEAYEAGQRIFGESRVQELVEKISKLPEDISWHFIGHLQTNKVKNLIGKASLIESVDSERLISIIDEESRKKDTVSRVLLQVHVAREETKFGFSPEEILNYFKERKFERLTHTHISGIMAMASNTEDEKLVRNDFKRAAGVFFEIKEMLGEELRGFDTLSMGMSGDWPIAVEEGSNMIRIGSAIFGERKY